MQNNVKKTLLNLAVSIATFIILAVVLITPSSGTKAHLQAPTTKVCGVSYEKDGVTYVGGDSFSVYYYPKTAQKGDMALIIVHSDKEVSVDIQVYYASGASTSDTFVKKLASADLPATWEWKISSQTSADKLRVVLTSDDTYAQFYIDII